MIKGRKNNNLGIAELNHLVRCHAQFTYNKTDNNLRKEYKATNYNSLKTDFENYLKSKSPEILVNWMKKVGVYVISE